MHGVNFIEVFIEPLEQNRIDYMITGSVASIVYGEPRLTHDVDLVLHLEKKSVEVFLQSYPLDKFYAPPMETVLIEMARESRAHFNIIHHESGYKADCYLLGNDPLQRWGLQHKRRIELASKYSVWIAPPEYVILRKLQYYAEGESPKHLTDIAHMLEQSSALIDFEFVDQKVIALGLTKEWTRAKS